METLSTAWTATRNELRARRERREQQRRLERDLASYTSVNDRIELDAIISRAPAAEAAELERILSRQRAA